MLKNGAVKVGLILLLAFLITSIGLNIYLYRQGRAYYLALNSTRLDPLGVNSYFVEPSQLPADKPLAVFFGDSRAADWVPPTEMSEMVFVNRGIGAQTTSQVLARFPVHILPLDADVIVIQVGVNDLKTIPLFPEQKEVIIANCKANIQEIVDLSVQSGTRVVLTTIFPLGRLPLERRPFWSDEVGVAIDDVNSFITTMESEQVKILDTGKYLANSDGITNTSYSRDFLHLNDEGYAVLNRELVKILR
ncbi:MAG: SGNH/GDSL hydrolase family protein [Chloroflexota bacterium]